MAKWIAAGAVVLIVALLLLWRDLGTEATAAAPQVAQNDVEDTPSATSSDTAQLPDEGDDAEADEPAEKVEKIDPKSEKMVMEFDEKTTPALLREAVKCYENPAKRLHRNQELVIDYKYTIKDGKVTFHDFVVKESDLDDPALESCFLQQIRNATWTDPRLPDLTDSDELVINPERGLKKYTRENIEYVGPEGPQWGPDGKPINSRPEHRGE